MKTEKVLVSVALVVACISSSQVRAASLQLGPIVRDDAGEVIFMNQRDAIDYCVTQERSRLPTIQEIAQILSPGSVSETFGLSTEIAPASEPAFDYVPSTYRRPEGEDSKYLIWSKSRPGQSYFGFAFNGSDGVIWHYFTRTLFAVRCLSKKR